MVNTDVKQLAGLLMLGLGLLIAAVLVAGPGAGQALPPVSGIWLDQGGKAHVEVAPCGGELCGRIVWLKEPLAPNGKPWTDMLNPDRSKRARQVCGLQIIGGLRPGDGGAWRGGWVYDPEEGKTYNVELALKDADTLTVTGWVGVRLLSETMVWKRQAPRAERCKA